MHEFNWRPGIGDPSIGGWLTVLLYVLAAISAWRTARQLDASESRLWRSISVAFLGLGLNKQLDLQTAITELGRILAHDEGWYGQRQIVQFWFIVAVAVTCLLVALVLLYLARRSTLPTWFAWRRARAGVCCDQSGILSPHRSLHWHSDTGFEMELAA
jgi:hypothetical protein